MKGVRVLLFNLFLLFISTSLRADDKMLPQRVLYIGHRFSEFEPLLKKHFAKVESVSRDAFQPSQAQDFDVVLLDWPQGGNGFRSRPNYSPLGPREEWGKPTVLLGSAGLNLAVVWKLKGGSGCTCLAPVAYGLKDHEIFKSPIPVDIKATTNIPTPKQFTGELKSPTIEVLPLIDGILRYDTVIHDNRPGWSTHYYEFEDMPEVEIFSGGINEQTPRSAALWRQGNLLHFGFEQSPEQLNPAGCAMLIDAIVYISHFTQDRPIDVTPSVFGPEKIGVTRRRAKNYLLGNHPNWATNDYSAATLNSFNWHDPGVAKAWFETNGSWLHPGPGNMLKVDVEAKTLGVPFDSPEFLPKTIAALSDEKTKSSASVLLDRYAPCGPGSKAGTDAWQKWWHENSPYLFYSELGCYRWYIDPLAKKRGIPTRDLRGPLRADVPQLRRESGDSP